MAPLSNEGFKRQMRQKLTKALCVTTTAAMIVQPGLPVQAAGCLNAINSFHMFSIGDAILPVDMENVTRYDLQDMDNIVDKTFEKQQYNFDMETRDYVPAGTIPVTSQCYDIDITTDGTYVITGSNCINGANVDVHITVESGVTANLIFDGATIINDDTYARGTDSSSQTEFASMYDSILDVKGTANIYVKSDSTMQTPDKVLYNSLIALSGSLNMKESEENATLTITSDVRSRTYAAINGDMTGNSESAAGILNVEGGNLICNGGIRSLASVCVNDGSLTTTGKNGVNATSVTIAGGIVSSNVSEDCAAIGSADHGCACDFIAISDGEIHAIADDESSATGIGASYLKGVKQISITGGTIQATGGKGNYHAPIGSGKEGVCDKVVIDGGAFDVDRVKATSIVNSNNQEVFQYTLTDLPASATVTEIAQKVVKGVKTSDEGKLTTYLPKADCSISVNGTPYIYVYNKTDDKFEQEQVDPCTVTFQYEDNTTSTMEGIIGRSLSSLPSSESHDYTFQLVDGTVFDTGTILEGDTTVYVTSKIKTYQVTIDGSTATYEYGQTLPEGYLYRNDNYSKIYWPEYKVCSDIVLFSYPIEERNEKRYMKISSFEDLYVYLRLANIDYGLNAVLENDIDCNQQSLSGWSDKCQGTFEGNYHSIQNMKNIGSFIDKNEGIIENLCIKNSEFKDETGVAAICRANFGTIKNCISLNNKIETTNNQNVGGICAYNDETGKIENCISYDNEYVSDPAKIFPISEYLMSSKTSNCYYLSETEQTDGGKTKEQFASGEVAYLLNDCSDEGDVTWYQTIGEDAYPVLDKNHKAVRKNKISIGESITKVYDQTAFEITIHKGEELNWSSKSEASLKGYYLDDQGQTKTTSMNSGAKADGDAPVNAGTYYAKVTLPADDNYMEETVYIPLTITGANTTIKSLTMEGWTYGETASVPESSANSNATPQYQYKQKDANESTYVSQVPTHAGEYTVKVTYPATTNYAEATKIADFTIAQKSVTPGLEGSAEKTYDGTSAISKDGLTITLDGVLEADKAEVTATADLAYADSDVADNVDIVGENIALTGAKAANYKLSQTKIEIKDAGKIKLATAQITIADGKNSYQKTYGDTSFKLEGIAKTGDGTITYTVSESKNALGSTVADDAIITVDANGQVTVKRAGTATITVSTTKTKNYAKATEQTIQVTVSKAEPKMTLGNLSQKVKDIQPVTVTINPNSKDATPIVEYGTKKGSDIEWSTKVPSAAGVYSVRAYLPETKAGENLKASGSAENPAVVGELTITEENTSWSGPVSNQNQDTSDNATVTKGTNTAGNETTTSISVEKDSSGKVTSQTKKIVIADTKNQADITVNVSENATGDVKEASATIQQTGKQTVKGTKGSISAAVLSQIAEAAGTDDVSVSVKVAGKNEKTMFTLNVMLADLVPSTKLYAYRLDSKTGELVMYKAKPVSVSKNGNVTLTIKEKDNYQLLNAKDAKKVNKAILAKVKLNKSAKTIETGQKTTLILNKDLNLDNVNKITYVSSNRRIATVNKEGKITGKKKGTVTITVKVTLKDGTKKNLKSVIKVK